MLGTDAVDCGNKTILYEDCDERSLRPCQGQGLNVVHTTLGLFTGHLWLRLILTLWDIASSALVFAVHNGSSGYRGRVILLIPSLHEPPEPVELYHNDG